MAMITGRTFVVNYNTQLLLLFPFRAESLRMDILLAAVLGELTNRSINFFISSNSSKPTALDVEDRLSRILLRAQVIIDEAMGRLITNQAMLQQLDMLRQAMHQGYYILDAFRYQPQNKTEARSGQVLSRSFFVSKINPLQGLCSSNRNTEVLEQMQKTLDHLSSMILDVQELVILMMSYPRIYRQPYSMHLLLGNCMFGRQMETELIINFLLHSQPPGFERFDVLPIVGPHKVGKSTLVAHVCKDERVCNHFSEILFLRDNDLTGDVLVKFRQGCEMEHHSVVSNSKKDERLLVVVELVGDFNEDAWNGLYSTSTHHVPSGSKVIVTSQSDNIIKFGTRPALRLEFLSHEAYWYFFKTLTFGSIDPNMHPRFAHLAMEVAKILSRCFIGAKMTACFLAENFDIHLWYKVLNFLRSQIKTNVSRFGGDPFDLVNQKRPTYIGRMATPSEYALLYDERQCAAQEEVPRITVQDVMYGSVKTHGKFKVLGWRSQILPYHSYILTCEIRELKTRAPKRKRSIKN